MKTKVRRAPYITVPRDDATWIQTYTGRQFWPLDPRPEEIAIEDVAHALSNICRYTGHCRDFYSVAQHSVLASELSENRHQALWLLLHDASEAYLTDVARPVKRHLVAYRVVEDRLMRCVAERFGLDWPMPEFVKKVDVRMLATERRDLMPNPPRPWLSTEDVVPLPGRIICWGPRLAEAEFLRRFCELTGQRVEVAES